MGMLRNDQSFLYLQGRGKDSLLFRWSVNLGDGGITAPTAAFTIGEQSKG